MEQCSALRCCRRLPTSRSPPILVHCDAAACSLTRVWARQYSVRLTVTIGAPTRRYLRMGSALRGCTTQVSGCLRPRSDIRVLTGKSAAGAVTGGLRRPTAPSLQQPTTVKEIRRPLPCHGVACYSAPTFRVGLTPTPTCLPGQGGLL